MELWDVIVAGGGPAGAVAARALARSGRSVLLAEASHYDSFRAGETLPPYANVLLAELGLRDRFLRDDPQPSHAIWSAWGTPASEAQHFVSNPYGHGYHVDRRRFDAMLIESARDAGASVLSGARVSAAQLASSGADVTIVTAAGSQPARARMLIDATGRHATVGRALGARRIVYDRLIGIMRVLAAPEPHDDVSDVLLLEAIETGYFYCAPLPAGALLIALMTDGDEVFRSGLRPAALWQQHLAEAPHTHQRAAAFGPPGPTEVRGAASSRLLPAAGACWIAVGDAACAQDPLSAEGVCKAIRHGLQVAEAVHCALAGDAEALGRQAAQAQAAFDSYRQQRARYYAIEQRWPDASFWRRRQARVTERTAIELAPEQQLVAAAKQSAGQQDRAEALLPIRCVEHILQAFAQPRAAHIGLAHVRANDSFAASDRELVLALSILVEDGALLHAALS